jgi:hypothetical protein
MERLDDFILAILGASIRKRTHVVSGRDEALSAYSARLNSYVHHKITSTPAGARFVYPNAFSVLIAPDGDQPEDHAHC